VAPNRHRGCLTPRVQTGHEQGIRCLHHHKNLNDFICPYLIRLARWGINDNYKTVGATGGSPVAFGPKTTVPFCGPFFPDEGGLRAGRTCQGAECIKPNTSKTGFLPLNCHLLGRGSTGFASLPHPSLIPPDFGGGPASTLTFPRISKGLNRLAISHFGRNVKENGSFGWILHGEEGSKSPGIVKCEIEAEI
jgi:hypothetical protein